ncbi:LacI family DNA-binding transcriptional regulator [Pseudonocardia acaciae]|uniref:LacI family DNA-binding transcriptional regulator n=1 Tax=Pseudonocardia acaciae TaxID=551276 RepID=UPI00048EF766|nr:LacI family DNA-binding transcriptional regulator [Pseudonocardia acaciae]
MGTRAVTLQDVADAAGFSITTTSDALSGGGRVSAATVERIEHVASRLGYLPNAAARHLRKARTGSIGVYLPPPLELTRTNYYMNVAFGAVERAGKDGVDVTLLAGHHVPRPRVDGIVLVDPAADDPTAAALARAGLPVVSGERYPGAPAPTASVRTDHAAALTELLEHLREGGSRRPALLAVRGSFDWARTIRTTYLRWCRSLDLEPRMRTMAGDSSVSSVPGHARALLRHFPEADALVLAPDGSAVAALEAAREAGRRVGGGGDLMIAACVDGPVLELCDPAVTAIDLRPREFGRACADALLGQIDRADPAEARIHAVELRRRASTHPLKR